MVKQLGAHDGRVRIRERCLLKNKIDLRFGKTIHIFSNSLPNLVRISSATILKNGIIGPLNPPKGEIKY
jgi:hypothetical protein